MFEPEKKADNDLIKSISFSYNSSLGDLGAIALSKDLSKNICEIGLVNCGISDVGGIDYYGGSIKFGQDLSEEESKSLIQEIQDRTGLTGKHKPLKT